MGKLKVEPDGNGYIVWERVDSESERIPFNVLPYSESDKRLSCDCDEPDNDGFPMDKPCSHVKAVNKHLDKGHSKA